MDGFLTQVAEYGFAITLIGAFFLPLAWFFIKRDQQREVRMGERLDQREADARKAREAHIGDLREIVQNNTKAVQELTQTLAQRPCICDRRKDNV